MSTTELDWTLLLTLMATSFCVSIVTSMIVLKLIVNGNHNNNNNNNESNTRCIKPISEAVITGKYRLEITDKKAPKKTTLIIPPPPIIPPTSINKVYWMDGRWESDRNPSRYIVCDGRYFNFKDAIKRNSTYSSLLNELIPTLCQDTIQIITMFLCEIDLVISKYVLLDCLNGSIQFYLNDTNLSSLTKTMLIGINRSTPNGQEILKYIANETNKEYIECSIYFHDNINCISNGQYFILSLLFNNNNNNRNDINMSYNILCQFYNDEIYLIQQIYLQWNRSLWSNKLGKWAKLPLLDIKFDGNYIYAAKDNIFSVNVYNKKRNILQNVILTHQPNERRIKYYQLYNKYIISSLANIVSDDMKCNDFRYLMVSRENYSKLQIYKIDSNNIRYLYHEFELKHIFNKIHNEYHDKYDKNGRNGGYLYQHNILGFDMSDNDILFAVYYNSILNRLFIINIKLSIFEDAKLINYQLLDGKIGNILPSLMLTNKYLKCLGIETIETNKNGKEWLVFCQCSIEFNIIYQTEFRINAKNLIVKYGKRKRKYNHCRYLNSYNRKQLLLSKFML